jgi:lipopolysaccharide O-acetyltransferase
MTFNYLHDFYNENGLFLTCFSLYSKLSRIFVNSMLSYKLRHPAGLSIGSNSYLRGLSHISIGRNFRSGTHLRLEAVTIHGGRHFSPTIIIKNNVSVSDFVHIAATNYVEIGSNVLMASKIYISDHHHGNYSGSNQVNPESDPQKRIITNNKRVIISDNVWIGEMVSVLPGVTIGAGSVIGANSVVTKDIPPCSIAVGNPAKIVKCFDLTTARWVRVQ